MLVVEGSIPNDASTGENGGFWAAMGVDAATGQPIKTTDWIDRLAQRTPWCGRLPIGTCATYRRHPRDDRQSDRLRWASAITSATATDPPAACPSSTCPAVPCNPTTSWRRSSTCLYQQAMPAMSRTDDPRPRRCAAANVALRADGARGLCDRGGWSYEQADFRRRDLRLEEVHRRPARLLGPRRPLLATCLGSFAAGWINGIGGVYPERPSGMCIGCIDARQPDKFMPFNEEPPGAKMSSAGRADLRPHGARPPELHEARRSRQGAALRARRAMRRLLAGYTCRRAAQATCTMTTTGITRGDAARVVTTCRTRIRSTRIVGSLKGIHTKIDFANRRGCSKCKSTSSIFRG